MSDTQAAWVALCRRAAEGPFIGAPFEIDDVVPEIAETLKIPEGDARRLVGLLLGELERLPADRQIFDREGNAVVPLPAFFKLAGKPDAYLGAYPFEL